MKLLLDQNLSWRLVEQLRDTYPDTEHIKLALSTSADDRAIWEYAHANGFTIVSKDDDFVQRSLLNGHPSSHDAILAFFNDEEKSLIALP